MKFYTLLLVASPAVACMSFSTFHKERPGQPPPFVEPKVRLRRNPVTNRYVPYQSKGKEEGVVVVERLDDSKVN